jgi:hypothetical protein
MYPANRWQGLCSLGTDGVDVMYSGNRWQKLCGQGTGGRSYVAWEQAAGVM